MLRGSGALESMSDPGAPSAWEDWQWEDWSSHMRRRKFKAVPPHFAGKAEAVKRRELTERFWRISEAIDSEARQLSQFGSICSCELQLLN